MSNNEEFKLVSEIYTSKIDIEKIINSGLLESNKTDNLFFHSLLTRLLILTRDITFKSYKLGNEIDFTDDVNVTNKITNVSMLIKYSRDAACHIDSDNHTSIETGVNFSFNVAFGKGTVAVINNVHFTSDYDDDVCVFIGDQKIYLKRHIYRAANEAISFLKDHFKNTSYSHLLQ
ncbi:TPA: hypothetical protein ACPYUI_003457 [Raoultella ornithinolytica]|jgi:hypothetical protein|uniref:hypothetical protein n=1 Tax=Raoultella ornithinolytica TaxID=54291 RepID=UPI00228A1411|nr:hypothetical protein [Raoultella ornithinolytica]MEB7959388.1 hypothetical protein [Raoultella ornithinolytica]MEB7995553.1 hypothetical protein [Raoultella ornithinolytica]HCH7886556.1 hypothetical protein [Raoultella ornithinolytica]HCT7946505.1 hypothetical protein [Raoultella ornithinolytica]